MAGEEEAGLGISFTVRENDIPAAMTANAQATKEFNAEAAGLTMTMDSLNEMVEKGAITGEQYRAAIDAAMKADKELGFELQPKKAIWADMEDAETQVAVATDKVTTSVTRTESAHRNMYSTVREGRMAMMVLIADLELMRIATASGSQQFQELTRSIQSTVETGLIAYMATGQAAIAIGAALAAGMLDLAIVSMAPTPEIQALNKELDSLGKQDTAVQALAKLAGVTNEQAAAAIKAAKENPPYRDSLVELTKAAEPTNIVLNELGKMAGWVSDQLGRLAATARDAYLVIGVQFQLAALGTLRALGLLTDPEYNNRLRAMYMTAIELREGMTQSADAVNRLNLAILNRPPTTEELAAGKQRAEAWQSYQDAVSRAYRSEQEQLADTAFRRSQEVERTQMDIERTERGLTDKLSDLEWQREHQSEAANLERVRNAQQANDEIARAAMELALSLMEHDFNVAESGYKATTYSAYLEIERRGKFERDMTIQRADLQMNQATKRIKDEQTYAEQKKALDDEQYRHSMDLERRSVAEREDDIRKNDALQAAANAHQLETVKRRYADEIADAFKRYNQELGKIHETAAAHQAVTATQMTAGQRLQEQYVNDWTRRKALLTEETGMRYELSNIPYGPAGAGGRLPFLGAGVGVQALQHGGSFMVPPGFNRDNFIVGVSTGERVTVTPRAGTTKGEGLTINFNAPIYGIDDVRRVVTELMDLRDRGRF